MEHFLDSAMLTRRILIHLAGVGGIGAQLAACLTRLDTVMREQGHPAGLHITAFDHAPVRKAVVGRQTFSAADIGHNKAQLQIYRLNQFTGADWIAHPTTIEDYWRNTLMQRPDILISCVDTRATRRAIHQTWFGQRRPPTYWLDTGNGSDGSGQVVLGQFPSVSSHAVGSQRLPCVTELFPDLLDPAVQDNNQSSCSVRESVRAQGLFVNDFAARHAAQLLFELLTRGRIEHHGAFFNADTHRSAPLDISFATWRRYGLDVGEEADDSVKA